MQQPSNNRLLAEFCGWSAKKTGYSTFDLYDPTGWRKDHITLTVDEYDDPTDINNFWDFCEKTGSLPDFFASWKAYGELWEKVMSKASIKVYASDRDVAVNIEPPTVLDKTPDAWGEGPNVQTALALCAINAFELREVVSDAN